MKSKPVRWITADRIFDGKGGEFINAALGIAKDGRILHIENVDTIKQVEKLNGSLCPGFINAHCHLELSALIDVIPPKTGLVSFLSQITGKIFGIEAAVQQAAIAAAEKAMWESGIVACGDISNTDLSIDTKKSSLIRFHTFLEIFGTTSSRADVAIQKGLVLKNTYESAGLSATLSPHAPYSAYPTILKTTSVIAQTASLPISIHMQESAKEDELFRSGTGEFIEFYKKLDLDISLPEPGKSSLEYTLKELTPDTKVILVHNTATDFLSVNLAAARPDVFWCFCPKANIYIEDQLPNYALWKDHTERILVGTDSLASNDRLSILDELIEIAEHAIHFDPTELVQFVCWNAARFFGWESELGAIEKGRRPGINLITKAANGNPIGRGSTLIKIA